MLVQSGSGGLQDALNQITALSYGEAGCPSCSGVDQLNSVTDAKSQQTSFSYDQLGRLVTATDPLGLATTYSYGATKNPTTKTAPDTTSISWKRGRSCFIALGH